MLSRRDLATTIGAAALAAPAIARIPGEAMISHRTTERISLAALEYLRDVASVPAVSYAAIGRGRIVQSGTQGLRRAGGDPATAQTFFAAASLTKPVFATVVLALARSRVLDLDRPLQSYLPLFNDPVTQRITARHVLSHSTGLPNWNYDAKKVLKSEFTPGSRWGYSGEAHFILLHVVEHLTGGTLAGLVDEHVFGPAGMKRSAIVWNEKIAADNAWPHDNFGEPIGDNSIDQTQQRTRFEYAKSIGRPMESWTTVDALRACVANKEKPFPGNASPNPAFGLWTTAEDYARFLLFACRDPVRAEPVVRLRGDLAWAAGWGLELGKGGRFAWHWGDSSGIKNFFMLHLPSRTGLVILTNSDNGAHIYRRLVRQYFGREFDAFLMV